MAERRTANPLPRKPEPKETAEAKPYRPKLRQFAATWIHDGVEEPLDLEISGASAPTPAIPPPVETRVTEGKILMLEDGKSFIQDGVRYFPLSSAAPIAQAPRSSLLHWIKKGAKFDGQPLQTYHFAPANRYYISEDSIRRAANRFVKWPSQEPAGAVTLGQTRDQSGYIGIGEAARTLGVDHHTIWLWATHRTAPTAEPLDVVKCPPSDQFYIRERDVSRLKKLIPRSGLKRGRRAPTLKPG